MLSSIKSQVATEQNDIASLATESQFLSLLAIATNFTVTIENDVTNLQPNCISLISDDGFFLFDLNSFSP
jgi:hypothetical protein